MQKIIVMKNAVPLILLSGKVPSSNPSRDSDYSEVSMALPSLSRKPPGYNIH
jgi:hypothetical protein